MFILIKLQIFEIRQVVEDEHDQREVSKSGV